MKTLANNKALTRAIAMYFAGGGKVRQQPPAIAQGGSTLQCHLALAAARKQHAAAMAAAKVASQC